MNKEEFMRFAMILKTTYPKENLLPSKEAMSIWYKMLMDIPYQIAEKALEKWIGINKWPPTIADIREYSAEISKPKIPDWGEAWSEVLKSVSRYGYYREVEALNAMRPITRQVTEMIGYKTICTSENITAERANFRKCYEIVIAREKENQQLPAGLLDAIKTLQIGDEDNVYLLTGSGGGADNQEKLNANGTEPKDEEVVPCPLETIQKIRESLQGAVKAGVDALQ